MHSLQAQLECPVCAVLLVNLVLGKVREAPPCMLSGAPSYTSTVKIGDNTCKRVTMCIVPMWRTREIPVIDDKRTISLSRTYHVSLSCKRTMSLPVNIPHLSCANVYHVFSRKRVLHNSLIFSFLFQLIVIPMYSAIYYTKQVWNKAIDTPASGSTRNHDIMCMLMATVEELQVFSSTVACKC